MKKIFFMLLSFCVVLNTIAGKNKEYIPSIYLMKTEVNKQLKVNEAVFHFQAGQFANQTIRTSINGVWVLKTLDKTGHFSFSVEPGNYTFQFYVSEEYEELTSGKLSISAQNEATYHLNLKEINEGYQNVVEKPVDYVYAPAGTTFELIVVPKGEFLTTYPLYSAGWKGKTLENGCVEIDAKKYPYLFWDAQLETNSSNFDWQNSSCVAGKDALVYLERMCAIFGFNATERTDFITYWGPRLAQNSISEVIWIQNDNANMFAHVKCEGFTISRIYMVFREVETETVRTLEAKKQNIYMPIQRTEKCIVEWGGLEMKLR